MTADDGPTTWVDHSCYWCGAEPPCPWWQHHDPYAEDPDPTTLTDENKRQ